MKQFLISYGSNDKNGKRIQSCPFFASILIVIVTMSSAFLPICIDGLMLMVIERWNERKRFLQEERVIFYSEVGWT